MAHVRIPAENRQIDDPKEIGEFLAPFGIWYEKWDVEGRVGQDATSEEILKAYAPEIERLSRRGGFVAADVVNVTADTPNLQTMLDRFNKEHTHSEDEVRFIVKGRGVFHIHLEKPHPIVFSIETDSGDLINVPVGTRHWFDLCAERTVRAIRLFQDKAGWTPTYIDGGIHGKYEPVCFGPTYVHGERVENKLKI